MAPQSHLPHSRSTPGSTAATFSGPRPAPTGPPAAVPEPPPHSFQAVPINTLPRLEGHSFRSAILPDPEERAVRVYLPLAYEAEPDRRFPVFYLHDGQNLFDEHTACGSAHPWCIHTTTDRLIEEGSIEPLILVGIANTGPRRIAEYTHSQDPKLGGGEGRSYGRMLVEELKPLIDRTYRTRPDAEKTGLGGSSLGGLISLFLGFEYPQVFAKLAVMSPSLWWDGGNIMTVVESIAFKPSLRIWLDMGTEEGAPHLHDADLLFQILQRHGWQEQIDLAYQRIAGAGHSEDAWAARFDDVLRFLFPAK
ncbi:MAG TPA: alpha/beta hydrolase-fold protein [Granulicella sp.]|nr:alpha/beta hydrolase-fold protein [Granulicella sp.]